MTTIHQDEAARRHISHLLLEDSDFEYGVLFMIMGDADFNTAAHAILDTRGITDPELRELVWKYSNGHVRLSSAWCRMWLEYKYESKSTEILTFHENGP